MTKKLLNKLKAKNFIECELIKSNHKEYKITKEEKEFLEKVEKLITLKSDSLN